MSASEKETRTQTVTRGQEVRLHTRYHNVLRIASAAARVHVFTPADYDGPDVLAFCTTDGLGAEDGPEDGPGPDTCRFWQAEAVADHPCEGRRIEVPFTLSKNAGTERDLGPMDARPAFEGSPFALLWYPTGDTDRDPIVLFEGEAFEDTWSVGAKASVMAHFAAAQFREAREVALPGEMPPAFDPDDPLAARQGPGEEHPDASDPTVYHSKVIGAHAEPVFDSSVPVKRRPVAGDPDAPYTTEGDAFETPGGGRWIHLYRRDDADSGADARDANARDANARDANTRDVEHLGTYAATEGGTYRRARFDDDGALSVDGPEQSRVLLPINTDEREEWTLLMRLTPLRISRERIEQARSELSDPPMPGDPDPLLSYTPLCMRVYSNGAISHVQNGPYHAGQTTTGTVNPMAADGAPGLTVHLPNPLTVAERRVGVAEAAHRRYLTWHEKMGSAPAFSGLVAGPCFDGAHNRSYLKEHLAGDTFRDTERRRVGMTTWVEMPLGEPRGAFDMADAWRDVEGAADADASSSASSSDSSSSSASSSVSSAKEPEGFRLLEHFAYGARRQETALKSRRTQSVAAADRVLGSAFFWRPLALDRLSLSADDSGDATAHAVERMAALFPRLTALGGGEALARMLRGSGVLDHLEALDAGDVDRLLDPLAETGALPLADAVDDPAFKVLFTLFQGGATTAHLFAQGAAPQVIAWEVQADLDVPDGAPPRAAAFLAAWIASIGREDSPRPGVYRVHRVGADGTSDRSGWRFFGGDASGSGSSNVGSSDAVLLVQGGATHVDPRRPTPGVPWRLELRGRIALDVREAERRWVPKRLRDAIGEADSVDARVTGRVKTTVDVINLLLSAYTVASHTRTGDLDLTDAVAVAKVMADGAGLVQTGMEAHAGFDEAVRRLAPAQLRAAGRFFVRAAPFLDAVELSVGVYEQLTHQRIEGTRPVDDPNLIGLLGIGLTTAGSAIAGAGVAATSLPFVAAGGLVILGGSVAMWIQDEVNKRENEESDPLTDWLPHGSLWGAHVTPSDEAAFEALFALVRPGEDHGAAALPERLRERLAREADTFTEKAFVFPTTGGATDTQLRGAWERDAILHATESDPDLPLPVYHDHRRVDGVALHVAPHYLPAYGTLLVDGRMQSVNEQGRPVGQGALVKCVVHYLKQEDGFRYRVLPVGENGRAHALPYTPDRPLIAQVGPEWAASETVSLDGADVPALTIRLTDGPIPDPPEMPVDRPEEDDLDEGLRSRIDPTRIDPTRIDPTRIDPTRIRDTQTAEAMSTRVATPPVPRPDPALLHVPGLADVLTTEATLAGTRERWVPYRGLCECPYRYRGPRFRLVASVRFNPLLPFNPNALANQYDENRSIIAFEDVDFIYPDDALPQGVQL